LLGGLAFQVVTRLMWPLQPAGRRAQLFDALGRLDAGGGTAIRPALEEAERVLRVAAAPVRHVILLTDGQSDYAGIAELVSGMAREHITVSAVGVGPGADRTLLSMIATRRGGRFYATEDPEDVPQIFVRD